MKIVLTPSFGPWHVKKCLFFLSTMIYYIHYKGNKYFIFFIFMRFREFFIMCLGYIHIHPPLFLFILHDPLTPHHVFLFPCFLSEETFSQQLSGSSVPYNLLLPSSVMFLSLKHISYATHVSVRARHPMFR